MADDWVWKQFVGTDAYANGDTSAVKGVSRSIMDQWQPFRFLIWPFIVGSAATQFMYIVLWSLIGTRLNRDHAISCIAAGVAAFAFAVLATNQWINSETNWIAFTIGLCVLAGVQVTVAGPLVARIS